MKKLIYVFIVCLLFVNAVSAAEFNMNRYNSLMFGSNHLNEMFGSNLNDNKKIIIDPSTGNLKDAIEEYDEIILSPGVYTGEKNRNIIIPNNRSIYVHSLEPDDATINAEGLNNIFTVQQSSTLKLEHVKMCNGSSQYGGIVTNFGGSISLNHCYLSDNEAYVGGALFLLPSKSKCEIFNTIFTDNNATTGGSIFASCENNDIEMVNTTITKSKSNNGGGCFFTGNNSKIVINNCNISNNNVLVNNDTVMEGTGGGVGIVGTFDIDLNKSKIHDNKALLGGGIFSLGKSNIKSRMNIFDCSIDSNEASNYGEGVLVHEQYGGAGIATENTTVYLLNVNLTRNNASYSKDIDPDGDELSNNRGGGYYNYNGDVTIDNCRFEDNFAYNGGGLDTRYGIFHINNSVFQNNLATFGGGIYTRAGNLYLENTNVSNNNVNSSLNSSENVSANASGGGIYNLNGTVHVDGCNVTGNTAVDNGGGLDTRYGNYTIMNSLIGSNSGRDGGGVYVHFGNMNMASSTVSGNNGEYGAGLCCEDGDMDLVDTNISGNVASLNAGGAYNINGKVNVNGCNVMNNIATAGNGGGLDTRYGNFTVVNSRFANNKAYNGGCVYVHFGNVLVQSVLFEDNGAVEGGAVHSDAICNVTGSKFTNNSADEGGAVFNDGMVSIDDSSFEDNSACSGGGVYNTNKMNISNTLLNGNFVSFRGGAIYNDHGDLNIKSSTLTNNSILNGNTADNGGAIFNGEGNLTITDSSFENNNAKPGKGNPGQHGCGGAIDNFKGNLTVSNSRFDSNHARYGGAINSYYAHLKLINCQITNNIVDSVGGGVCSNDGTQDVDSQTRNKFDGNKPSDMFHFLG
ncbi:MAG: hypothetical protein LBC39_08815 [Methanobrevibacter sp.]|jgi:hypothetical protein|nr:hypothetical protein [Candidatus Methanovirga aequatorialis]